MILKLTLRFDFDYWNTISTLYDHQHLMFENQLKNNTDARISCGCVVWMKAGTGARSLRRPAASCHGAHRPRPRTLCPIRELPVPNQHKSAFNPRVSNHQLSIVTTSVLWTTASVLHTFLKPTIWKPHHFFPPLKGNYSSCVVWSLSPVLDVWRSPSNLSSIYKFRVPFTVSCLKFYTSKSISVFK